MIVREPGADHGRSLYLPHWVSFFFSSLPIGFLPHMFLLKHKNAILFVCNFLQLLFSMQFMVKPLHDWSNAWPNPWCLQKICQRIFLQNWSCRSSRWILHEIVQCSNCLPPRNSDEYFTCENGCCLEICLSYLLIYAGCCCGNLNASYFHKLCVFFPSLKNTARIIMVRSLASSSFWLLFK